MAAETVLRDFLLGSTVDGAVNWNIVHAVMSQDCLNNAQNIVSNGQFKEGTSSLFNLSVPG